jgi:hypothetical protein
MEISPTFLIISPQENKMFCLTTLLIYNIAYNYKYNLL